MYSQNNEEQIIEVYFTGVKGTYIDIGANDGITLSNTYALYLKGWQGVCVEPSPKAYGRLTSNQPKSANLQSAIASYDGEIEFNESGQLLGKGDVALVSSTKQDEMDRWVSLNMPFEKMKVPCCSPASLLAKSPIKQFDLFCIDIEGMELEVLPLFDLNAIGVKMAIIEWNGKHMAEFESIMKPQGFRLHASNAENLIYIKRNTGGMLSI